ncbi:Daunorubicin resistance ABC transporter membrane protein [Candidatus Magnetoovum chiemensis]|nr:Daunorubicin resistance ABC transporter membrane protein [Candidatus Magnetoovum chiemensis]
MIIEGNVINVIVSRELKKFVRQKSRLLSSLMRPVLWLYLVGGGLSKLIQSQGGGGIDYLHFIFPGIMGMTILFSSVFSAISIIWDKEFGYMKEILVAPVSRASVVIGKALSGSLISTIQASIVLILFPTIGLKLTIIQIVYVIILSFLLSFTLSSVGILIASLFTSFDSFTVIMNFIIMPMYFLSGAMYPVKVLPEYLQVLVKFNPLTYGIDALKNVIFPDVKGQMSSDFSLTFDVGVILMAAAVFTFIGAKLFNRRD